MIFNEQPTNDNQGASLMKIASITLAGVLHVIERAFMAGFIVVSIQITLFVSRIGRFLLSTDTLEAANELNAFSLQKWHQGLGVTWDISWSYTLILLLISFCYFSVGLFCFLRKPENKSKRTKAELFAIVSRYIERTFVVVFIAVSLQITFFLLWLYARTTFSFDALSALSLSDLHQGIEIMHYSFNTTALILFSLLLCVAFKEQQAARQKNTIPTNPSKYCRLRFRAKKILWGAFPIKSSTRKNEIKNETKSNKN
ncbi:membrane protein (plasmid) [Aliivibrio salmonicida LFI1238]|uniref:Membrane protein n=2 Tax=Aliivibrio salmonicida TaxID=40269 RepID=B6ESY6_ALISL|nr:membrane protein [Aliivibrio salmonicida LFI1238]